MTRYTYKNTSFSSDRSHSHSYFVVLVDKFDSRWKDSVAVESLSDNETRILKKLLQENKISVMANSNKEEVAINI